MNHISLLSLIFENQITSSYPEFYKEETWEGKRVERLIDLYIHSQKEFRKQMDVFPLSPNAIKRADQQFKKLHDYIANIAGDREKARWMILRSQHNKGYSKEVPKGYTIVDSSQPTHCILIAKQPIKHHVGHIAVMDEEDQPASKFTNKDRLSDEKGIIDLGLWNQKAKQYMPEVWDAIGFLKIPFEPTFFANESEFHEKYLHIGVELLYSDAFRIFNYLKANQPETF